MLENLSEFLRITANNARVETRTGTLHEREIERKSVCVCVCWVKRAFLHFYVFNIVYTNPELSTGRICE